MVIKPVKVVKYLNVNFVMEKIFFVILVQLKRDVLIVNIDVYAVYIFQIIKNFPDT